MAFSFKPALLKLARLGLDVSWTRWLQLGACAVVAWVWLRPAPHNAPPAPAKAPQAQSQGTAAGIAGTAAAQSAAGADGSPASAAGASPGQTRTLSQGAQPAKNASPQQGTAAQAVSIGTAAIDVIVNRNDTLDHIFRKLDLSLADLASLRSMPGIKTHLDHLRPGELLHLTHRDAELVGFERRLNENETLKVVRENGDLRANVLQDPLEGRARTIRGVIDHSLFEAVTAAGAHDQTAVNLAEIFGWDIDFVLDIQPGDSFAVTYRELYQNGVYMKDGPVLAAKFVNEGRAYFAVRYVDPDGNARYLTPDGRNMHKAFLRAPVEFTRISSRFNTARMHPILNLIRAHKGIDYAAPIGTPVRAAGDGRISYAGPKGGYGNVVEIEHSRSIMTVYGHLSRFAKGLRVGQHVTQGTVIAFVGMTGLATGPHLHYEYRVNGVFKNPQTVPLPDAAPIEARYRDDFLAKSAPMLATLEAPLGTALVAR
ncbi:MAG: M23 family metallopeptidase [Steroidobacteraceae bacterium]